MNPFAGRGGEDEVLPKIHVQKETTVTSEMRKPSQESWASERGMLRKPDGVLYRHQRDGESVGSGRQVSDV